MVGMVVGVVTDIRGELDVSGNIQIKKDLAIGYSS